MPTVEKRVKAIIAKELGVPDDEVTDEARLGEQLFADSLDAVSLTMALEEEFGIEIPDHDAEQLIRVSDIVKYVQERVGTASV